MGSVPSAINPKDLLQLGPLLPVPRNSKIHNGPHKILPGASRCVPFASWCFAMLSVPMCHRVSVFPRDACAPLILSASCCFKLLSVASSSPHPAAMSRASHAPPPLLHPSLGRLTRAVVFRGLSFDYIRTRLFHLGAAARPHSETPRIQF